MFTQLLISALFLVNFCTTSGKSFTLASKKFVEGDMLPKKYTCDGKGVSPPLYWENAPSDTVQFMITRSNIYDTKLDLTRYDWMVYGISKNKNNIDTDGSEEIGKLGGCSPGVEYIYRSSCSEGQGMKLVTFTVYALNEDLEASIKAKKTCDEGGQSCDVSNQVYQYLVDNKSIIDTAVINTYYCGGCSDAELKEYCKDEVYGSVLKQQTNVCE